ncbi:fatty acid desaturase-domain-containing protein [Mycena pura]|uniref:Fatty acid desaturase-domain-containing protein n=1 Tax=Mycena pura TaxID=153505 RepID=A0AAD6VHP4_9AGAR|nr:fatty acid desaturase-domain-containing protein [Mycena pura]
MAQSDQSISADGTKAFVPLAHTLKEIKEKIPAHLFKPKTAVSILYLCRDLLLAATFLVLGLQIDSTIASFQIRQTYVALCARWACWMAYWWFQGLTFTGLWVIGHECGHGAFSGSRRVCDAIGFVLHTALLTPYFSWKYVHHRHHSNHASMENDEVYVPHTRTMLHSAAHGTDLEEYLADIPIYTMFTLVRQHLLAFPAYSCDKPMLRLEWLLTLLDRCAVLNVSGQRRYPRWSNHFNPKAVMFSKDQWWACIVCAINAFGSALVFKLWGIPWLFVTHWFIMITYLHHTDPKLPHYRKGLWNYQRGAAATIDRDFLGWQGRFFLHDVAHFHVIHHFFPMMPWYHGEQATGYLREVLGDHYHRSDAPVFRALWYNYNFCQFVDDEGDVVFYRNRLGETAVEAHNGKKA